MAHRVIDWLGKKMRALVAHSSRGIEVLQRKGEYFAVEVVPGKCDILCLVIQNTDMAALLRFSRGRECH
jgi:hypothetical protein